MKPKMRFPWAALILSLIVWGTILALVLISA